MKPEQLEQMLAKASKSVQRLNADLRRACPAPSISASPVPSKARIRQSSKPLSNKLETSFGNWMRLLHPKTPLWEQAITFRLCNGVKFTPDWIALLETSLGPTFHCYEIKGPHMWEDSVIKIKVAASTFPQFAWFLCWKQDDTWMTQAMYP